MSFLDYFKSLKAPEQRLAWVVAIGADACRSWPFRSSPKERMSPADSLLDLIVASS